MTTRSDNTMTTTRAIRAQDNPRLAAGARWAAGAKRAARARRQRGFTLVELLTSVFIIVVIMVIIFPVVGAMKNGSRIEAGLNTVSLASDVARAWSTASLPQADLGSDPVSPVFGATYSGTAAIFCPTGEVRIVINDQRAVDNNGAYLESFTPSLNGYRDFRTANGARADLDYISIPHGSGVAGVYRNNAGAHLIAPPFAIAYDRDGQMIPGANTGGGTRVIYYDSNFDGAYTGSDRGSVSGGYDPADWDKISAPFNNTFLVHELPFEAIETVAGVVVYSTADARAAGYDFSGGGAYLEGSAGYNWLRENGTAVFFSPSTGVALRDEGIE